MKALSLGSDESEPSVLSARAPPAEPADAAKRQDFFPLYRLPHTGPHMRVVGLRGGRYFTHFELE